VAGPNARSQCRASSTRAPGASSRDRDDVAREIAALDAGNVVARRRLDDRHQLGRHSPHRTAHRKVLYDGAVLVQRAVDVCVRQAAHDSGDDSDGLRLVTFAVAELGLPRRHQARQ